MAINYFPLDFNITTNYFRAIQENISRTSEVSLLLCKGGGEENFMEGTIGWEGIDISRIQEVKCILLEVGFFRQE